MYTEIKFNGKVYQIHTEQAYAMGKDAFMAAHTHVPDAGEAWKLIAKAGKKKP